MIRPNWFAIFFVIRLVAAPWSATAHTSFPPIIVFGKLTQCVSFFLMFVQYIRPL
ncbi:hypothetical protein BDF14DRAFT_1809054, partial [Spinellus fusiger]